MKLALITLALFGLTEAKRSRQLMSSKHKSEKKEEETCPVPEPLEPEDAFKTNEKYQKNYLIGLNQWDQDATPLILRKHTSGTTLDNTTGAPFKHVPITGFTAISPFYDEEEWEIQRGEFYCLAGNGYGESGNSFDYALHIVHMKIEKKFAYRWGEASFENFEDVEEKATALIHDPHQLIKWENDADIQVTYAVPDRTWLDYKYLRVLTGRDFNPQSMAVINQTCAIVGDSFVPSIFAVNPLTGEVKSGFVRIPDIDPDFGNYTGAFLSTTSDKVHCNLDALVINECPEVDEEVFDDQGESWTQADPMFGGFTGMALLADGTMVGFLGGEFEDEPGIRVYRILPGDCTEDCPPQILGFQGFYKLEKNADYIADVTAIPESDQRVLVLEKNDFPEGHTFPMPSMPANKLCIVDITVIDDELKFERKVCVLHYADISDPWDVDASGTRVYAQSWRFNDAIIAVDDYCFISGTRNNFPFENPFELEEDEVPFFKEVMNTNFMHVCFLEPILDNRHPVLP